MLNVLPSRYETGRSVGAPAEPPAAAADRPAGGEQLRRAVVAQLGNVSRHDGGLYVCTADNGVTAPVERVTRILVRREYNKHCLKWLKISLTYSLKLPLNKHLNKQNMLSNRSTLTHYTFVSTTGARRGLPPSDLSHFYF